MMNGFEINGRKITAAIFDMDGTLIDSLLLWDVFWRELGTRYLQDPAFRPNAEDERAVRTVPLDAAMALIRRNYLGDRSDADVFAEVKQILADFYANTVELKPGAGEFLAACRARGTAMCVASATEPALIASAMDHCGIAPYFSRVVSCAESGKGKDAPDVFLQALAALGAPLAETAVIEDSPVALETAAKAGFLTVGVYDRFNPDQERVKRASAFYIAPGETLMKIFE